MRASRNIPSVSDKFRNMMYRVPPCVPASPGHESDSDDTECDEAERRRNHEYDLLTPDSAVRDSGTWRPKRVLPPHLAVLLNDEEIPRKDYEMLDVLLAADPPADAKPGTPLYTEDYTFEESARTSTPVIDEEEDGGPSEVVPPSNEEPSQDDKVCEPALPIVCLDATVVCADVPVVEVPSVADVPVVEVEATLQESHIPALYDILMDDRALAELDEIVTPQPKPKRKKKSCPGPVEYAEAHMTCNCEDRTRISMHTTEMYKHKTKRAHELVLLEPLRKNSASLDEALEKMIQKGWVVCHLKLCMRAQSTWTNTTILPKVIKSMRRLRSLDISPLGLADTDDGEQLVGQFEKSNLLALHLDPTRLREETQVWEAKRLRRV